MPCCGGFRGLSPLRSGSNDTITLMPFFVPQITGASFMTLRLDDLALLAAATLRMGLTPGYHETMI
jgi:hypothetical protein